MASEALHVLRFKHGSAEFELTSTAEEVASARAALEGAILAAFSEQEQGEAAGDGGSGGSGGGGAGRSGTAAPRRRRPTRRPAGTGEGDGSGERARIDAIRAAPLTGFPQIGDKPQARWAAYALLSWAHKELDIDGLTAQDIEEFMTNVWRLGNTHQAYAKAMKQEQRSGEILIVSNTTPRIFRLMGPGEKALAKHLAAQQAKKT